MTYREELKAQIEVLEDIIKSCGDDSTRYKPWVEGMLEGMKRNFELESCYLDKKVIK